MDHYAKYVLCRAWTLSNNDLGGAAAALCKVQGSFGCHMIHKKEENAPSGEVFGLR